MFQSKYNPKQGLNYTLLGIKGIQNVIQISTKKKVLA